MKVLVSAFACAPGRGSEPGVGWMWGVTLAKISDHQVTVLTQARNRASIEAISPQELPRNLAFRYVSLFGDGRIPFGTPGHYAYYYLWQLKALLVLARTAEWRAFGLVHHLTYGGIRAGSLLWLLPRPFMFGPVGGGESAPVRLLSGLALRHRLAERARRLSNAWSLVDPLLFAMQRRAVMVLAKTAETARILRFGRDVRVRREIGAPRRALAAAPVSGEVRPFRVLYAGRLIYWKGCRFLLDAMKELQGDGVEAELFIAGDGREDAHLRALAGEGVHFLGRLAQEDLLALYREADLFVFPSLHDSSGNVVLEAMSFGLPVICFGLGGPPLIVGEGGIVLDVSSATPREATHRLAAAIRELRDDPERLHRLRTLAVERARKLSWERTVRAGYGPLLFDEAIGEEGSA